MDQNWIKFMDQSSLILVEQHFRTNGLDFNKDKKICNHKKNGKNTNIYSMIE